MKQNAVTSTKVNLFALAKKAEPKEPKSKIASLPVPEDIKKHLTDYKEAKEQHKKWEGKKKLAEGVIKERAIVLFLNECRRTGRNIGSFKLGEVTVSIQIVMPT